MAFIRTLIPPLGSRACRGGARSARKRAAGAAPPCARQAPRGAGEDPNDTQPRGPRARALLPFAGGWGRAHTGALLGPGRALRFTALARAGVPWASCPPPARLTKKGRPGPYPKNSVCLEQTRVLQAGGPHRPAFEQHGTDIPTRGPAALVKRHAASRRVGEDGRPSRPSRGLSARPTRPAHTRGAGTGDQGVASRAGFAPEAVRPRPLPSGEGGGRNAGPG